MRRRHLQLLSLWILPLLLARALIPIGFMLSVDAGSLRLTFCPSGVIQPRDSLVPQQLERSAHHAGMHHAGAADDEAASHNDNNAPCPFSLVAAATPSDVPYLHDSLGSPSAERFDFISAPTIRVGPIRTDPIRGPPATA
jgi:hypothetical protein